MLKELSGLSFDDKAYMMALAVIDTKIKALPPGDRDDLFEVLREFLTATDEGERESAALAIEEIMEPAKTPETVRRGLLAEGEPEKWMRYISDRIRLLRTSAGLTQEKLAERSGLTQSHVCRLERGEHSPNGLTLEKLARGLGVPTSKLDPTASEHE